MFIPLERLPVYTTLGIRFWDPLLDRQIRDCLRVTAWPEAAPQHVVNAFQTRSGVYAFQGLPGLLAVEHRVAGAAAETGSPPSRRFIVQVADGQRRFLRAAFAVDLPLPYSGVFLSEALGSPAGTVPKGFLLFSAPNRTTPSWFATLRGQLTELASGDGAAHAVVQVRIPGERSRFGLADHRGRFRVVLSYPTMEQRLAGSPSRFALIPPLDQRWPVAVAVRYEPDRQLALPGTATPDYRSILGQEPTPVWPLPPARGADETVWTGELAYGDELIVRTAGRPDLLVGPLTSSP